MRQMAAAGQLPQAQAGQPATSPIAAAPTPEPAAPPVTPPVAEPEPAPEPVAEEAAADPESEDMDQAFAAALAEAAADSEMRSSDIVEPGDNDLVIDADDVTPAAEKKTGKRRFGLFGGGGDKAADKKAAKAPKKEKKSRPPKPARRRAGILTWVMWLLFVLMVGGICAAIYLLPTKIVSIWPPAEHLYKSLQIPVSKTGSGDSKSVDGKSTSTAAEKTTPKGAGRTSGDAPQDENADAAGQAIWSRSFIALRLETSFSP